MYGNCVTGTILYLMMAVKSASETSRAWRHTVDNAHTISLQILCTFSGTCCWNWSARDMPQPLTRECNYLILSEFVKCVYVLLLLIETSDLKVKSVSQQHSSRINWARVKIRLSHSEWKTETETGRGGGGTSLCTVRWLQAARWIWVKVSLDAVGTRTTSAHFGVLECAVWPYCDGSDVKLWLLWYRYDVANKQHCAVTILETAVACVHVSGCFGSQLDPPQTKFR